jgi:enamine deaminase RidA (YjgF/YER057c/UK114 family)
MILVMGVSGFFSSASAQETQEPNLNITGQGRTALLPNERMKKGWYDSPYHFSPAVRAGDYIFVSGTVAGAYGAEEAIDRETYKASVRRAFQSLQQALKAGGADLKQVVKLRTFHVFPSKWINIPKTEQILVVSEIKDEFIGEPHPAWTAVGVTELFPDQGLVEIEVVAYAPQKKEKAQ